MLENYNKRTHDLGNIDMFIEASNTIEKSVKLFLNHEYIGEGKGRNIEIDLKLIQLVFQCFINTTDNRDLRCISL